MYMEHVEVLLRYKAEQSFACTRSILSSSVRIGIRNEAAVIRNNAPKLSAGETNNSR